MRERGPSARLVRIVLAIGLLLAPATASALGDLDGDGILDGVDVCPRVIDGGQLDTDGDGYGDACDRCPTVFDPAQLDTDGPTGTIAAWADRAFASSEFSPTDYSAMQATGPPEQAGVCGDAVTSWSPLDPVATDEWIELRYRTAVYMSEVVIHESLEAGFVTRLQVWDTGGGLRVDIPFNDSTLCGDTLSLLVSTFVPTNRIRVWTAAPAWEEIDAVELIGTGPTAADGVGDACDNCPGDLNPDQLDTDGDGQGDVCDPCPLDPGDDTDGDGQCDGVDPCPLDPDDDLDGDGVCGDVDTCPAVADPAQIDTDGDGEGDACDADDDDDGLADVDEPAAGTDPLDPDSDDDGLLDGEEVAAGTLPLDPDSDGDGLLDGAEIAAGTNPLDPDTDGDGVDDDVDGCPLDADPGQADTDGDGIGDACENCPLVANPDQANVDGDAAGDACDNCPFFENCVAPGVFDEATLEPTPSVLDKRFGVSVDITPDGRRAIVGASGDGPNSLLRTGAAYVFVRDEGGWLREAKLAPPGGAAGDEFGHRVAISDDGTLAVVTAPDFDVDGAVFIYERGPGGWIETQTFVPENAAGNRDGYGGGLALAGDGSTIAVGAPSYDGLGFGTNTGAIYVLARDGSNWVEEQQLLLGDRQNFDSLGRALALTADGTILFAGVSADDIGASASGSVRVFERLAGSWLETATIVASDPSENDRFGHDVAITSDGSTVLVGTPSRGPTATSGEGAAYVVDRNGPGWTERSILTSPAPLVGSFFGDATELSPDGSVAFVGALSDDGTVEDSGAAYRFTWDGSSWNADETFVPAVAGVEFYFGATLAASFDGSTLIGGRQDYGGDGGAFVFEDCQADGDGDAVGNLCDPCAAVADPLRRDLDGDGFGNVCDADLDGDGLPDATDTDDDQDGVPEDDLDGGTDPCPDGVVTGCDDNCPTVSNADQRDTDGDGVGDACDLDDGRITGLALRAFPPAAESLLLWPAETSALAYNVYSGRLVDLVSGDYGSCLESGLVRSDTVLDVPAVPPGDGRFYLVGAVTTAGEQSLGTDGAGNERTVATPCP